MVLRMVTPYECQALYTGQPELDGKRAARVRITQEEADGKPLVGRICKYAKEGTRNKESTTTNRSIENS